MKITLLASTKLDGFMPDTLHADGYVWQGGIAHADELAELAGRGCYKSWLRPNAKTRENEDYLAHILEVQHESVLAHAAATFYVEDVSRGLTHELVRSRFLVFSQESQRYVDSTNNPVIMPPALKEMEGAAGVFAREKFYAATDAAFVAYQYLVEKLVSQGAKRKEAREAARAVLPNATATSLTLSGNHRAFRDFVKQRYHVAADREIRDFAGELLRQLREIAPSTYQDLPTEPFGS